MADEKPTCGQKVSNFFTGLKNFFWNSERKEVIGRTGKSWGLIFIFYVIYYLCLSGFWIGMLAVFFAAAIDDKVPLRTGKQSFLRGAPGIGFFPRINSNDTLFNVYTDVKKKEMKTYFQLVTDLLDQYPSLSNLTKDEKCDIVKDKKPLDDINKPCKFSREYLGKCEDPVNSMKKGYPCVYLQMNKIYGWLPPMTNSTFTNNPLVQCRGINPADKENIGKPQYYPSYTAPNGEKYGKISNVFFPYLNTKSYSAPLVAVRFHKITPYVVVLVECQLVGIQEEGGTTQMEILVQ